MAGSGDTGSDQLASLVPDATFAVPASAAPENLPASPDLLLAQKLGGSGSGAVEEVAGRSRRWPEETDQPQDGCKPRSGLALGFASPRASAGKGPQAPQEGLPPGEPSRRFDER